MTTKVKPPTERQRAMLAYIIAYKAATQGESPTMREIGRALGGLSTSNVKYNLARLAKLGCVELARDGRARAIRIPGAKWVAPQMEVA